MTPNSPNGLDGVDDTDVDEKDAPEYYEELARKLLRRKLRTFRDEHLSPAASDLERSIGAGEPTAAELSEFAAKSAEYAEVSADILNQSRDMKTNHPATVLLMHGGGVFSSLARAGEWFTLDDEEKERCERLRGDGELPTRGTPARAAYTLRRVWRMLDDVAQEQGEPLPEELRPPTDDVDDEPGGGERC